LVIGNSLAVGRAIWRAIEFTIRVLQRPITALRGLAAEPGKEELGVRIDPKRRCDLRLTARLAISPHCCVHLAQEGDQFLPGEPTPIFERADCTHGGVGVIELVEKITEPRVRRRILALAMARIQNFDDSRQPPARLPAFERVGRETTHRAFNGLTVAFK
jgi:hypothetical protein